MAISIKKNNLTNKLINRIFGNAPTGSLFDDDLLNDTYDFDSVIEQFLIKKLNLINIAFLKKYKYMPTFKMKDGQKTIASIYFFDILTTEFKHIDFKETLSETGLLLERIEIYLMKHMIKREYIHKKDVIFHKI